MTPQPNFGKDPIQQFDEMFNILRNLNISVPSVWIQEYGLSVGIHTNFYDWSQITDGATINNAMLWYWDVYGSGPSGETPANFDDFRPFGGWAAPSVQFGQMEFVCGIFVNRDVYSISPAMTAIPVSKAAAPFSGIPESKA